MKKVAVVGVGETKFSGPQNQTAIELFAEAAMEAIHGSNLKPKDIQALFVGNVLGDFSEGQGTVDGIAAKYNISKVLGMDINCVNRFLKHTGISA